MFNSKIVKEAHKMAKEIKREYPEVNYQVQFGLCLSYLLKEEENTMVEVNKTYNLITNKGTKVELKLRAVEEERIGTKLDISKLKYNGHIEYDIKGTWAYWSITGEPIIKLENGKNILVRNYKLIEDVDKIRL